MKTQRVCIKRCFSLYKATSTFVPAKRACAENAEHAAYVCAAACACARACERAPRTVHEGVRVRMIFCTCARRAVEVARAESTLAV
eukprot:2577343-Pleurochrysis_carterae.AAC.3